MSTSRVPAKKTIEELVAQGWATEGELVPFLVSRMTDRKASQQMGGKVERGQDVLGNVWGWSYEDNSWEISED